MPDLNSTVAFPSQDCTPNVENAIDDAKDLQILDSKLQISTTSPKKIGKTMWNLSNQFTDAAK